MKPIKLFITILTLIFSVTISKAQKKIAFVEELLEKMTLDEKIGQLNLITPGGGIATGAVVSKNVEEKLKSGQVGGMFGVAGPEKIKVAQDMVMKNTRLKIPLIIGSDVIHGYKTTFPIPLATSCTWDMEMIEKEAQITAKEATADGIMWNFSPMVDIARDPRWGRIAEGAGEDPYLSSAVARAMVKGYQGNNLSDKNTMMACVKHFALYGAAEGGRDYNSVDMSHIKMFNQYFPPYKAAVDAGVGSVMSSFNDVDGIPATGNKWLLTDVLRNKWGFKGFVVSDYTSINEMIKHGLGNLQDVSVLALKAGLDMDMVGEGFLTTLKKSVEEGKVTREEITNATRLILEAKYKLGLFDNPYLYIDKTRAEEDILTKEHRDFARKIATRSFVLLKNDKQILPLKKDAKIALIGPLANDQSNMLGTWAPTGDYKLSVPVFKGIQNIAPNANIVYAKGANITDDTELAKKINVFGRKVSIDQRSPREMLNEAVKIAKSANIIVAVVGEASEMSGESASMTQISLPESQKKLIRALVKTGKPVVLVLMSGRPLVITEEFKMPVSILQVWHPGVEAGNAIADVLFGNYNPSGKLTASWPRSIGQIPIYYSEKNTGRPEENGYEKFKTNYLDVSNTPLIPFGYGLSYTTFEYSDIKVDTKEVIQVKPLHISVNVKNTGKYDGEEVVQLYIHDVVRSITPPKRQLKGFKKVFLKKGESKTVTFTLLPDDLKFYDGDLNFIAEPGIFEVFVGTNSNATLKETFKLK